MVRMQRNLTKHFTMNRSIFILCAVLSLTACKKEETPEGYVSNGSFESNGNFSTDGWVVSNGTSATDVPTGGGSYSLRLNPAASPGEGYAEYVISDLEGAIAMDISCYMKAFGDWPGSLTVKKRTEDNVVTTLGTIAYSENNWAQKTVSIAGSLESGDELIIHLSSGSTEIPIDTKYVLFDLVVVSDI